MALLGAILCEVDVPKAMEHLTVHKRGVKSRPPFTMSERRAGDGVQPMHVIARLLLHVNTPHTPSGTHMCQETCPAGVGRCEENFGQVSAGVTTVSGRCCRRVAAIDKGHTGKAYFQPKVTRHGRASWVH